MPVALGERKTSNVKSDRQENQFQHETPAGENLVITRERFQAALFSFPSSHRTSHVFIKRHEERGIVHQANGKQGFHAASKSFAAFADCFFILSLLSHLTDNGTTRDGCFVGCCRYCLSMRR